MTAFEAGQTVGRYRILRPLGAGAMGVVYLAQDPQIERLLAIKTVRVASEAATAAEQTAQVKERTERLLREAKTAGRLIHPNIVTLFDAGEEDGTLYLAFEYVEGESLAERLVGGQPLTVAEALRIAREAALGLDYAHRRGIVHRDIKPGNLLLSADGQLKISDFGIAKMVGQATELTVTGSVVGSPQYLSPEQVRGEELDGRSDLFSLGIVLYEMVGGRRPFEGDTFTTLLYKILHESPPPIRLQPDLAPALARLLGRLLAKYRDSRLPDGASVAEELTALESELDPDVLSRTVLVEGTGQGGNVLPTEILTVGDRLAGGPAAYATRPAGPSGSAESHGPGGQPPQARAAVLPPAVVARPAREGGRGGRFAAVVLLVLAVGTVGGVLAVRKLGGGAPAEVGKVAEEQARAAPEEAAVSDAVGARGDREGPATAAGGDPRIEEAPSPAGPEDGNRRADAVEPLEPQGGPPPGGSDAELRAPQPGPRPGGTASASGRPPHGPPPGGFPPGGHPPPGGFPSGQAPPGARNGARGGATGDQEPSAEARGPEGALERRPALRRAVRELAAARGVDLSRAPVDQKIQVGSSLAFDVEPAEAFVLLNGTVIGRAAEFDPAEGGQAYALPGPGEYLVKLRAPGMADHLVLVEAVEGGPARSSVTARLEAVGGEELELGDLRLVRVQEAVGFIVLPLPAERFAQILVDGEPAGRAIQFPGRLARAATWLRLEPGRHRVSIVAPGFVRQDVAVDVSAGAAERRQRIEIRLEPES